MRKEWLAGAAVGAAVGTLVLGVGGRLVMRGIALLNDQPPGFSLGGTTTVVFLGTVSGLVGGLVFVGMRLLLRTRRFLHASLFWIFLVLTALRGLRPIDAQRLLLFMPLVLLFGTILQYVWCRAYGQRGASGRPALTP